MCSRSTSCKHHTPNITTAIPFALSHMRAYMFAGGDFARTGCSVANTVDLYVRARLALPTHTFCNLFLNCFATLLFSIDFSISQFVNFDKSIEIINLATCNRYISVNKGRPMRAAQQPPNISVARANLAGAQAPHSHLHPTSCV